MATQTGTSGTQGSMTGTSGMRRSGQRGVSDDTYNMISVLYHCLQGCETYEQYAHDAEQAGNQELAQFFRETMQEEQRRAQKGQRLLMQCLQSEQQGGGQQMHSQGASQGQHMAGSQGSQSQMQGSSQGMGQQSGMSGQGQHQQSGISSASSQQANTGSSSGSQGSRGGSRR